MTVYPLPGSAEVVFDDNNVAGVFNASNQLLSYGTAGIYPYGTVNGGTIVDTGSYTYPFGTILDLGTLDRPHAGCHQQRHDADQRTGVVRHGHGPDSKLRLISSGGLATYTYVGGPKPVDTGGNVGTITSNTLVLDFTNQQAALNLGINFASIGANFTVAGIGTNTNHTGNHTGDFGGALAGSCTGAGCASTSVTGKFGGGMDGPNGYEMAVVGGGFYGTMAGPVVFLNAYQSSSFTPGCMPISNQTGALAYASVSPSSINVYTLSSNATVFSGTQFDRLRQRHDDFPAACSIPAPWQRSGSVALADSSTMRWGRWTGPSVQVIGAPGDVSLNPPTGVPYVIGDSNTVLPTSGTFHLHLCRRPQPCGHIRHRGHVQWRRIQCFVWIDQRLDVGRNPALAHCRRSRTSASRRARAVARSRILRLSPATWFSPAHAAAAHAAHIRRLRRRGNAAGIFVGPQGAGLAVAGNITSPAPTVSFAAGFKR